MEDAAFCINFWYVALMPRNASGEPEDKNKILKIKRKAEVLAKIFTMNLITEH